MPYEHVRFPNDYGDTSIWNVACTTVCEHDNRQACAPVALQLANSAVRLCSQTYRYITELWKSCLQLIASSCNVRQVTSNCLNPLRERSSVNTITDVLSAWRTHPRLTRNVTKYLHEQFSDRWIDRDSLQNWPPRSPDLSPLDLRVWGHMRNMLYERKMDARDELL